VHESLSEARNFRQVDERLLTTGQPNEAQLADAARCIANMLQRTPA
jgi:hypothetical protein